MKTNFYSYMKGNTDVQKMVNERFKKGLLVKFDDGCKMSKCVSGIS